MRFGQRVKEIRLRKRLSLRHVAEQLQFTPSYISDIERGNRPAPEPRIVRRWALIIDEDPEELLRLALLDRNTIDLEVDQTDVNAPRNLAALALQRRWGELTDEEFREIIERYGG